jgi:hypothetical protein
MCWVLQLVLFLNVEINLAGPCHVGVFGGDYDCVSIHYRVPRRGSPSNASWCVWWCAFYWNTVRNWCARFDVSCTGDCYVWHGECGVAVCVHFVLFVVCCYFVKVRQQMWAFTPIGWNNVINWIWYFYDVLKLFYYVDDVLFRDNNFFYIFTHTHIYIYIHIHTYAHAHTHTCACAHTHIHIYICACKYSHLCMHAHTFALIRWK